MLTVFDGANGYPISNDDYYIRELASGYNEIVFQVSIRDPVYQYIREEAVVRDRDQNVYLIKQIDAGDTSAKVIAQINLDDWKSALFMEYSNESDTVAGTVQGVAPAGWSVVDRSSVIKRRTIPPSDKTGDYNVTALQVLEDCTTTYDVRFKFDTKNKIITIVNPSGYMSKGAFATRDLNLVKLNYKGKSDNFVTRLYAEGADGLTFASINDGKSYVENKTYANKVVSAFWKDDRYTDAQSLLEDAQAKVDEMAVPSQSYDCDVLDLANTNPDLYGFEDFSLFEVITLIDDAKMVRTDYQVVERWTYPYYPAKNKVILSSSTPNIQSAIVSIVNSISSSTSAFQQMLQSAIMNATALITGNSGGYLILHDSNGDGTPDELLIMNTPDISTATKVWRWNQAGLGYSDNGYNGPYELGMTMDGEIVADFITAGELNGDIIKAGTIDAGALSVSAQEAFNLRHSFLPYDAFSNIARWSYPGTSHWGADFYFENITTESGTYTALVLDGTNIDAGKIVEVHIPMDIAGRPTFSFGYKMMSTTDHTFASQYTFMGCSYTDTNGTSRNQNLTSFPANYELEANTEISFDNPSKQLGHAASYNRVPYFRFYFIEGVKLYLYGLYVSAPADEYKKAVLSVTVDGLDSVVQAGSMISQINQSAEAVTINASKINLTGDLSLRGDFTSYDPIDDTNYAFLDGGILRFYISGVESFVIASDYYNGMSGIIFGDPDDQQAYKYTIINQNRVKSGLLLAYYDGSTGDPGSSDITFVSEGTAEFYGGIITHSTVDMFGTEVVNSINNPTKFFATVYNSSGGTVFVSDERKKKDIKDLALDKVRSFLMKLKPRSFKFKEGKRDHHGFVAQEVKKAMPEDWGLYIEDEKEDFIGLRYDELIADMVCVIQDQQSRIEALERRLNDLTDN